MISVFPALMLHEQMCGLTLFRWLMDPHLHDSLKKNPKLDPVSSSLFIRGLSLLFPTSPHCVSYWLWPPPLSLSLPPPPPLDVHCSPCCTLHSYIERRPRRRASTLPAPLANVQDPALCVRFQPPERFKRESDIISILILFYINDICTYTSALTKFGSSSVFWIV